MYKRNITQQLRESTKDTPVLLVVGARQTGKTTIVSDKSVAPKFSKHITLDDFEVLAAVKKDPTGFIKEYEESGTSLIIDEVQRAPELFLAIKASVDRDRRPGRFILTGSANVLMLPKLSDSLAGRIEIITLWPLSQAEIQGEAGNFVDKIFQRISPLKNFTDSRLKRTDLVKRIIKGGYPEPLTRSRIRSATWFESYVSTILQRDIRDLSNIEGLIQLPKLLSILAARTACLVNTADISRTTGIPYTSLSRYLTLLEMTYLIHTIPAWSGNLTSRLIKSPKIVINDTGLASHLLQASEKQLNKDSPIFGMLLENFVAMEIVKHISTSKAKPKLFHWHTSNREEVDLVLEQRDGSIVGIEVKATASPGASDYKGLRALKAAVGERFQRGVLLYGGDKVLPLGDKLFALPISAIWS
jgi:predicted AAA+ superfamily ATPase